MSAGDNRVFASPLGPVAVAGADDALIEAFRAQAPDWPKAAGDSMAEVTVIPEQDGLRLTSSQYDTPEFLFPPGLVAGNGLVGCLIHSFVAASDKWIALHAGAVETDGGLTVLAGDMMAGKSTLTAALVARGHRLWCDDRLPVLAGPGGFEGMALGLRPKLRRPLPPEAPPAFDAFFTDRAGVREGEMHYVNLRQGEAAGFDARQPIRRLVLLDRDESHSAPSFARLPLGETVKQMASCTFAPHLGPVGLLTRLRDLAEQVECVRLSYQNSFEAAGFAGREWGKGEAC